MLRCLAAAVSTRLVITGVVITLNDARVSDARFGITGTGITLNDDRVSDAKRFSVVPKRS
jgi:hypothetical protein